MIVEFGNKYRDIDYSVFTKYGNRLGIGSGAGYLEISNGTLEINN